MANNLTVSQQVVQYGNIVLSAPIRVLVFLLLISAVAIVAMEHPPLMVSYSAQLGNPERKIETLYIVNPNVEKRELFFEVSSQGDVLDFGPNQFSAVDLGSKSIRFLKLTVVERGEATVSLIRSQLEHTLVAAVPPQSVEIVSKDTAERRFAFAYFIGLLLAVKGTFGAIASLIGGVSSVAALRNPHEAVVRAISALKWIFGRSDLA